LNSHLRRRFIMAANTADGALLLVKKLGGIVLILVGIIGIAVGLEYRTIGFSVGITGAGIVALACGHGASRAEDRPPQYKLADQLTAAGMAPRRSCT
jgi:hypothetical protein